MQKAVRKIERAGWSVAAILLLLLVVGCSGRLTHLHQAEGYDPLARDGARYAIGGFVLRVGEELDGQADVPAAVRNGEVQAQTDTWAPVLYGAMLTGRADLEIWAWPAVRDNIPADAITALQRAYAEGRLLPPARFTQLATDLPDITYLVLARLDRNEVEIGSNVPGSTGSQVTDDSRDPHGVNDALIRTVKTRRRVTVTLDVYDLRTGLSVWSGQAEREKTELYSPGPKDKSEDLVVTPATEEGGTPEITVKGASLAMPELADVLSDACTALVGMLFAVEE